MSANFAQYLAVARGAGGVIKNWVMVAVTTLFILLYVGALVGWFKPLADEKMTRLEPLIFAIVGYCFGRLPSQPNERTLIHELTRQTQRADAAQHAKEQAQQVREALEEKVKNVRAALIALKPPAPSAGAGETRRSSHAGDDQHLGCRSLASVLDILNS